MASRAVGAADRGSATPAHRAALAVIGPDRIDQGGWARAAGTDVVVLLDELAAAAASRARPNQGAGLTTAVVACDAVVAVIPAEVGLDPLTASVWRAAAAAGLPRGVLVTGLSAGTADFEDLAAIAARVLGEECVPVELPVFDDDGSVYGSLGLTDGVLRGPDGPVPVERAHLRFSASPRLRLIEALAAVVSDDAVAERAMAVIEAAEADDPDADAVLWGKGAGSGSANVWSVTGAMAEAVAEGTLAPVLPEVPALTTRPSHAVELLRRWLLDDSGDSRRAPTGLVRRDEHGHPCDGLAAVVLAAEGQRAIVRPVFGAGAATQGLLTLSRTGSASTDPSGPLVPYRSWPVGVVEHEDHGGYADVTLTMRPAVGDVLSDQHLWLVPEE